MEPRARLVVIIAAHNEAGTVGAQLDALTSQPCPVDVRFVVVDNNSSDDTVGVVRSRAEHDERITLLAAHDGVGAGYARNAGAARTESEWIAFCDADDIVADTWLGAIATALETHAFVAGPLEVERLNEPWVAGSRGSSLSTGMSVFEETFPIASSCNLGIHRDTFDAVSGFDETFRYGQDTELSMRLWQAGVELHFVPEALVHYRYRASMRAIFGQSRRFGAAHPRLIARLRAAGTTVDNRSSEWRRWLWLARSVPTVFNRAGRARWLWVAGRQIGVTQGWWSVRRGAS